MTKQEEIRKGMESIIQDLDIYGGRNRWLPSDVVRKLQAFEDSQGVVIKVDRELPSRPGIKNDRFTFETYGSGQQDMLKASYVAVEPLIEEKQCSRFTFRKLEI